MNDVAYCAADLTKVQLSVDSGIIFPMPLNTHACTHARTYSFIASGWDWNLRYPCGAVRPCRILTTRYGIVVTCMP